MKFILKIMLGLCTGIFLLISFSQGTWADNTSPIFPNLKDAELLEKLAQNYAPEQTLGYNRGRDIMYTKIDNNDGEVEGIYTGYVVNIPVNSPNPRTITNASDMNAEHIYPQSKGAFGMAKSDLHILFPAEAKANNKRRSYPFADINDSLTDEWLRNQDILTNKPTEFIDEYSESLKGQFFEPREEKKGDVARAVFYFYTVHRLLADSKDPNFFQEQREALCQWDLIDPVDQPEMDRSHLVASFQGNENPFVLDSTLAQRTYCQ